MKLFKFEFSEMAASRIATPLVVDVTDIAQPNFKKNPFISVENDLKNVFLSVPYGVLYIKDIRVYTHCPIKDLGSSHMLCMRCSRKTSNMIYVNLSRVS